MKLLFVQPTGDKYGHFGLHVSKLAQELSLRGHSVTICTNKLDPSNFVSNPLFEVVEVEGGKFAFEEIDRNANKQPVRYWRGYFRNSWSIMRAALKLASDQKFDGVYITDAEFLMASISLKLHMHCLPPIAMQVNASNFSFSDYPGGILKKFYKVIQREVFRLTIGREISAFSILGDWHRPRLTAQLRLPDTFPVELIPDGGGEHPEPISVEHAREALGIDWTGDVFLFMGILRRDKGLEELAVALHQLWGERKDFRVILSGYPFEYSGDEIKKLFSFDPKDSPIVHWHLDYVAEEMVPTYFYAANALLLPYNNAYKGSSGPLMKGACTFGLPAVVSDVSEMGNLAKKHGLGFVTKPSDAYSLQAGMQAFLDASLGERFEIRSRAIRLGESNSWPEMAHKYENLFKRLICRASL